MNISRPFIIRPVATVLLMVAILLVGLVAYLQLPISALPEVNYPTIQVQTFYPGASPDVMASTVTEPLEKQFGQIPGLSQMTSTSSGGASVVVLQFSLREDIDVAEQEVQAAINSATSYLPSDLPIPPTYSKTNPADAPVLTLALTSKSLALPQLQDLSALKKLKKVGGNLFLQSLDQLSDQNLASFAALTAVGGDLSIQSIPNLVSLNGLSLLSRVNRVFIYNNQNLENYTGLKNVIPTLDAANWQVSGNKYNPGYQDMVNGIYVAP